MNYDKKDILEVELPREWVKRKLNPESCEIIVLKKKESVVVLEPKVKNLSKRVSKNNYEWTCFKRYCHDNAIYKGKDLKKCDNWAKKMLDDEYWGPKVREHLRKRSKDLRKYSESSLEPKKKKLRRVVE